MAGERGLDVIVGTLEAPELQDRQFAVVMMTDVVEHVDNPTAELAKAHEAVRPGGPGGLVVVNTKDVISRFAKLLGKALALVDGHACSLLQPYRLAQVAEEGLL